MKLHIHVGLFELLFLGFVLTIGILLVIIRLSNKFGRK